MSSTYFESSCSKLVEDINTLKIKVLMQEICIFWFILCNYVTMQGAKTIKLSFSGKCKVR